MDSKRVFLILAILAITIVAALSREDSYSRGYNRNTNMNYNNDNNRRYQGLEEPSRVAHNSGYPHYTDTEGRSWPAQGLNPQRDSWNVRQKRQLFGLNYNRHTAGGQSSGGYSSGYNGYGGMGGMGYGGMGYGGLGGMGYGMMPGYGMGGGGYSSGYNQGSGYNAGESISLGIGRR